MTTTVLIDADILIFKAAAAVERVVRFDDENHVLIANAKEAWDVAMTTYKTIMQNTGALRSALAFSGKGNFRKSMVSDTYKSNRKDARKPICYTTLVEWCYDRFLCRAVDGLEGDDLLGIWQTGGKLGETIIWSADKDMKTIPGYHWDVKADCLVNISEYSADYYWMAQTLTGDTADGYTGLPGCGPKTAEKILAIGSDELFPELSDMWNAVVTAYEKKGLGEDDALLQARLSRILRASDWDSEKKEVKLWTPPR